MTSATARIPVARTCVTTERAPVLHRSLRRRPTSSSAARSNDDPVGAISTADTGRSSARPCVGSDGHPPSRRPVQRTVASIPILALHVSDRHGARSDARTPRGDRPRPARSDRCVRPKRPRRRPRTGSGARTIPGARSWPPRWPTAINGRASARDFSAHSGRMRVPVASPCSTRHCSARTPARGVASRHGLADGLRHRRL